MMRSGSIEKKGASNSSTGQNKSVATAMSQEMVKGLQLSFEEMITPLSAGLAMLTEQIKGLNE